MALVNLKCPNCGGSLQMEDTMEKGFCMFCGTSFMVKDEIQRVQVEHSGTVNVNRKEEADNIAIIGEQKVSEKTYFTRTDCNYFMENYVEKALILDITNEKALALKKRLDKLIAALDKQDEESKLAAEKIRLENEENRPSLEGLLLLGCSIPVIIGLLLFILVSCVH